MADSQPWDREANESPPAYRAFLVYRDLGPGRTHVATRELLGKTAGYLRVLEEWSGRHRWLARAAAWDDHQARIRQEAEERAVAETAAEWARRREHAMQANWEVAQALRAKADQMLKFPVARQEIEVGPDGKKTIVHPAKWTFSTAARVMKLAAEIEEQAVKTALPDPSPPGSSVNVNVNLDVHLSQLSDADLNDIDRIAEKLAPHGPGRGPASDRPAAGSPEPGRASGASHGGPLANGSSPRSPQ